MVPADARGSVQLRGLLAPLLRPHLRSFSATSAGLRRLLASLLSAGPVLLRSFPGAGRSLSGLPVLLRGPFAIGRPGPSPLHSRGGALPLRPAGTPSRPFCCRPAPGTSPLLSRGWALPLRPAGAPSGQPVPLRASCRYRPAANSLSRAISSGQRSSSGVSRMSGMPSKRASEAM